MMGAFPDARFCTSGTTGFRIRIRTPCAMAGTIGEAHGSVAPCQASCSGREGSRWQLPTPPLCSHARLRRASAPKGARRFALAQPGPVIASPRTAFWRRGGVGSWFGRVIVAPPMGPGGIGALAIGEESIAPMAEEMEAVGEGEGKGAAEVVAPTRLQAQWMFLEQEMARQQMQAVMGLASEARRGAVELLKMWSGMDEAIGRRLCDPSLMARAQVMQSTPKATPRPALSLDWEDMAQRSAVQVVTSGRQARKAKKSDQKVLRAAARSDGYRDGSSLTRLFKHIGRQRLLSAVEEKELAEKVQACQSILELRQELTDKLERDPSRQELADACGRTEEELEIVMKEGEAAKEKMLRCNMRLVVSIARRYTNQAIGLDDLVAEGTFGLIRGIEKFDPSKGFKFSTYAHWWIRQSVVRATTEQARVVKVPVHLHELASKAKKREQEVLRGEGYTPSTQQLAEYLRVPEKRLARMKDALRIPISLDSPSKLDSGSTVIDSIEAASSTDPEDVVAMQSLKSDLDSILESLSPRERGILRLRYGLDDGTEKTLEEVGRHFQVTRERIRQIEAKAMRKLRHPKRSDVLLEYSITKEKRLERPTSAILRRS